MVDVDEQPAAGDGFANGAEPLEAGAVGDDDAVEMAGPARAAQDFFGVEKGELPGHGVLVERGHLLAEIFQRVGERELAADAVAIGPHVAAKGEGFPRARGLDNLVQDFQAAGHGSRGWAFCSSSSRMERTRSPSSMESCRMNFILGVYLRVTSRPSWN